MVRACVLMTGYATRNGDCDDADANIHPGAPQRCDNTSDGDCDGVLGYMDSDANAWCLTRPHTTSTPPTGCIAPGTPSGSPAHCYGTDCERDAIGIAFGDCNATGYGISDDDGCETPLRTDANCNGCNYQGGGLGMGSCTSIPGGTHMCVPCPGSFPLGSGYSCTGAGCV
jgi:hypothetical protein